MKLSEFEGATIHFHNDADGCCSGAIVCSGLNDFELVAHNNPNVTTLGEGKILVLDIGGLDAETVTGKDVTVIDHHLTGKLPCTHINPRFVGENYPASYATWLLFGNTSNAWMAGAGVIGDRSVLDAIPLFELLQDNNPELVAEKIGQTEMYESPLGKISRMLDANASMKGEAGGVENVHAMISLSPQEILGGKAEGMKTSLEKMETAIAQLVSKEPEKHGKLLLLRYRDGYSVKSQVANELLDRHPDMIVMVARESNGRVKASLRGKGFNLAKIAKKVTEGIGSGGGHPVAAGLVVPSEEFDTVLVRMGEALK